MDEFQSEKEQIEEIKKWWKEHRGFIVTGVILGVGFIGGIKYWTDFKENRAATASAQYEQLTQAIAQNDTNAVTELSQRLQSDFGATPYAAQAALAMARFYVNSDQLEQAAEQLSIVLASSKDPQLQLVARLRLARVQLSLNRADDALATLAIANPGNFAARFHEVRGDAYAALNRNAEARQEYQNALDKFEPGLFDQQFVEMKLNSLNSTDDAAFDAASDISPDTTTENEPGA